jgi:hypothetical protein
MKEDVQATWDALTPKKRTSRISSFFTVFVLALMDPDPTGQNQSGSGSTTLVYCTLHTSAYPQDW